MGDSSRLRFSDIVGLVVVLALGAGGLVTSLMGMFDLLSSLDSVGRLLLSLIWFEVAFGAVVGVASAACLPFGTGTRGGETAFWGSLLGLVILTGLVERLM